MTKILLRTVLRRAFVLIALIASTYAFVDSAVAQFSPRIPTEWLDDADLTDLFFLDANNGWVCGDHGLLLHTTDGGASWKRIETGVEARLESIWFADARIGWAAGGYHLPHSERSAAVLLKTVDGGKTWIKNRQLALPKLYQVQFANRDSGWAIGDGSQTFPSGVFITKDGGRNWTSAANSRIGKWRSGVVHGKHLMLIDAAGRVRRVSTSGDDPVSIIDHAHTSFRSISSAGNKLAWATGSDGWIARSIDEGSSWEFSNREIENQLQTFDLGTSFSVADSCWIAGRPGTRIMRTRDRGRSWSVHETGQSSPISKLIFVDATHGWAIGPLGLILRTTDGGTSWEAQRGANRRATMLAFFHETQSVPYELFSMVCGGEGRYAATMLVRKLHQDRASLKERSNANSAHAVDRFRDALSRVGCSSVEELMIDDASQSETVQRKLLALIRAWKPSVVVIPRIDDTNPDSFESKFNSHLLAAVKRAADESESSNQIHGKSLKPWQVSKVVLVGEQLTWSDNTLNSDQYLPSLGRTAEDHAMISRQLVSKKFTLPPEKFAVALDNSSLPGRFSSGSLLAGVPAEIGKNARAVSDAIDGNLESLRFLTKKRERLQELARLPFARPSEKRNWNAQLLALMNGLPQETAGNTLFQLADQYTRSGRDELVGKTLRLFINNNIDHPMVDAALVRLLQHHASGEIRYAAHRKHLAEVAAQERLVAELEKSGEPETDSSMFAASNAVTIKTTVHSEAVAGSNATTAEYLEPVDPGDSSAVDPRSHRSSVQPASYELDATESQANTSAPNGDSQTDHAAMVSHIAKAINRSRATLYQQPEIQFPLAAMNRALPGSDQKKESLRTMKSIAAIDSAWNSRALAEIWIAEQKNKRSPVPIARIVSVPGPPRLDGVLDEQFWTAISESPLAVKIAGSHNGTLQQNQRRTRIMFAHDREFIYIAAICQKNPDSSYVPDKRARPHDADLSQNDRIRIEIDIDRDYVSFYQFEIDYRGWVNESRFDNPKWNPEWYVAATDNGDSWSIEAAIPIAELAPSLPTATNAWSLKVARLSQGNPVESAWTSAGIASDESAIGLLQVD